MIMFKPEAFALVLAVLSGFTGPVPSARYAKPSLDLIPLTFHVPLYIPCADRISRTCGTHISDEQVLVHEAHFQANKIAKTSVSAGPVAVNLFWHVVSQV